MNILLRKVRIQDPSSPFHGSVKDILVAGGIIKAVEDHIEQEDARVVEAAGLNVSQGWVDIFADFSDPGYEHKESLETGAMAAAAGGYTHVFLVPNTSPAIHSKSQVEYIIEKSRRLPVSLLPIGAITRNTDGKELAEMYDMKLYDAIAFSDGFNAVQSAGLLIKALQYVKAINGVIIQIPDDRSINPGGLMNEGIVSTRLGLPGKPAMAEEIMVARDIKLARYTDSRLHLTGISSAKSVEYIRRAKDGGIKVTCSVTPYHLYFTDEDLVSYDTNLKVNLPLRTRRDTEVLMEAVKDGTIDCIATHHQPHEWDSKTCEFEYAKNGMIGLETCFGVLGKLGVSEEKIISLISGAPRKIFDLPEATISAGNTADLTLYTTGEEYVFTESMIRSKSKNTAFTGHTLKGRVVGIVNKDSLYLND
ncbi:MAG TPA: dihydroorotase [Chitinophagaceae bacterium]|nr:dihydroorotase [Chitinophagaceae bacterium]